MATKQFIGIDVTVAGTLYKGGRWHGPLTSAEVTAITGAGYGARIATVADIKDLPNDLD